MLFRQFDILPPGFLAASLAVRVGSIWAIALLFIGELRRDRDSTAPLIDVDMGVDSLWSVPEDGIKRRASRGSDTAPGFTQSFQLNHGRPASEWKAAFSSSLSLFFRLILCWDNESERVMKAPRLPRGNLPRLITSASSGELEICFLGASTISLGLIPRKMNVYHASKPSITNLYLVGACKTDSRVDSQEPLLFDDGGVKDFRSKVLTLKWVRLVFMYYSNNQLGLALIILTWQITLAW